LTDVPVKLILLTFRLAAAKPRLAILDGLDNAQRAKLIADRLSHWEAIKST
jgi:hypothetical protein